MRGSSFFLEGGVIGTCDAVDHAERGVNATFCAEFASSAPGAFAEGDASESAGDADAEADAGESSSGATDEDLGLLRERVSMEVLREAGALGEPLKSSFVMPIPSTTGELVITYEL